MSTTVRSTAASLRVFLAESIDYAGLFPPTSLDMATSAGNYARYLHHPQRWALGRFVLPASRLQEFLHSREALPVGEGTANAETWRLSAILSSNFALELAKVEEFNRGTNAARIDSIEARVSSREEIELLRKHQPPGMAMFFEIEPERADELLPLISRGGGRAGDSHAGVSHAKLRTGGVVAEAFPSLESVAGFLARCAGLGVSFKATAGLHHALRCMAPLTCQADSARTTMYGFLNLFTAAAIAWSAQQAATPVPRETLAACLADSNAAHWRFGDDALTWSGAAKPVRIELDSLAEVRAKFALSFGSCSFEEPMDELRRLELL